MHAHARRHRNLLPRQFLKLRNINHNNNDHSDMEGLDGDTAFMWSGGPSGLDLGLDCTVPAQVRGADYIVPTAKPLPPDDASHLHCTTYVCHPCRHGARLHSV